MEVVQHSALTGADLHSPKTHAASHENGGADLLQDVASPFGIHGASPALNFYDTDCTDSDINAQILVAATDTGSGTEDVDVTFSSQVAGVLTDFLTRDADGATTLVGTTDVIATSGATGTFQYSNGNIIYLGIGGDIETAITNATAGDTIVLAAGTYTITNMLSVSKKVHLKGQGQGITTLACSTDSLTAMIDMAGTDAMISDLTINRSGAMTADTMDIRVSAACRIENIEFINSVSGAMWCEIIKTNAAVDINIANCTVVSTGADERSMFVYGATAGATITIRNCTATVSAKTQATFGAILIYQAGSTIDIYDSQFFNSSGVNTGGVIASDGGDVLTLYNCTVSASGGGTAVDVRQTAGTLTLYNTTLVNNTTSGTITYAGTVSLDGIAVGTERVSGTRITLPQENDAATPTLAFGTGAEGLYSNGAGELSISTAGVKRLGINSGGIFGNNANGGLLRDVASTATEPTLTPSRSDTNTGIGRAAADQLSLIAGGVEAARLETTGMRVKKAFGLDAKSKLTIATGAVTPTKSYHTLDTESAGATDDLDTITGTNFVDGDIIVLRPQNAARVVTLKDGTGNLRLVGDFALSGSSHLIVLLYDGTNWAELTRSAN